MADRRRRRRVKSDEDSEDLSLSESVSLSEPEGEDEIDPPVKLSSSEKVAYRRRRCRVKSDEDSEEQSFSESVSLSESEGEDKVYHQVKSSLSSKLKEVEKTVGESEYESAEEEDDANPAKVRRKPSVDDLDSPTDLIDEEGGEEGIADADVEGEFLDGDASDDDEEDDDYVEEERQQGDGEECSSSNAPEKVLDLDEDRRNPQYIPKKGTFYEHDDRNNDDAPKEKEVESSRDKKKKKLWLDEGRWGHDRYREEEQAPKSRDELIEIYGYDIRCEDGPPRARRRRRYGRGPTKYQRSWEDATAYGREQASSVFRGYTRRGRGQGRPSRSRGGYRGRGSNFYRTNSRDSESERNTVNQNIINNSDIVKTVIDTTETPEDKEIEEIIPVINKMDFPALPTKEASPIKEITVEQTVSINNRNSPVREISVDNSVRTQTFENSNLSNRPPTHYNNEGPPRRGKNSTFRGNFRNEYRKPTGSRNLRGRGRGRGFFTHRGDGDAPRSNIPPRLMDAQLSAIHSGMEKLTVSEKIEHVPSVQDSNANLPESSRPPPHIHLNGNKQQNIVSVTTSKVGADSSSRPKRYSSLRQRSLPETSVYQPSPPPVPQPHPSYYDASYQAIYAAPETVTASPQPQTPGSPPIMTPAPPPPPPPYQTFPPPYQDGFAMRMPVNNPPPRVFPQVTLATGQPMLGAPCITPNANLMNFAGPPPPPPPASYATYTYQQYPTPPPPPPPGTQPPPDMYGAGITYYYTQGQTHPVRPVPQKRPKAAIPIVPPPENEVKMDRKDIQKLEVCNGSLSDLKSNSPEVNTSVVRTDTSAVQIQPAVEVES